MDNRHRHPHDFARITPYYCTQVFTRYGKCYMFNSGQTSDPLTTLKGGIDNGLEILLDTQQDEYMPVWAETGLVLDR